MDANTKDAVRSGWLAPDGTEWQDFPPTTAAAPESEETYTYVVCQSGEGDYRFWSNEHGWVELDQADHFTIDEVHTHGDTPVTDGFWMDYVRAQECVQ